MSKTLERIAAALERIAAAIEAKESLELHIPTPPETHKPAPLPTFEEVRAACLQVHESGQSEAVIHFLNAKGVKKLNELSPSNYKALLDVCAVCLMGVDRDYA